MDLMGSKTGGRQVVGLIQWVLLVWGRNSPSMCPIDGRISGDVEMLATLLLKRPHYVAYL